MGFPGCMANSVSTGATLDNSNDMSSYSNAANWMSLVAPGSSITSTVPTDTYAGKSGTSMAAPHVTGAFALLRSYRPNASVEEILTALRQSPELSLDTLSGYDYPRIDFVAAANELDVRDPGPADVIVDDHFALPVSGSTFDLEPADPAGADHYSDYSGDHEYYGGSGLVDTGAGPNAVDFPASLPYDGIYRVYAWWKADPVNAGAVAFDVYYDSASAPERVERDQRIDGSQWNVLGDFDLPTSGAFVRISDDLGAGISADAIRYVYLSPIFVAITSTSLANGTANIPYDEDVVVAGGRSPYSWSVIANNLSSGLSFDTADGRVHGASPSAGSGSLTVNVTDADGQSAEATVIVTIISDGPPEPLEIGTASLAAGTVQTAYSQILMATGGQGPMSWNVTVGVLPNGLSLIANTGVISGTPTVAGLSTFTVEVTDINNDTASTQLSIDVQDIPVVPLSIDTTSLADSLVQTPYTQTLTATGGQGPMNWSISLGTLPSGLTLVTSSGEITGIPTVPGLSPFTVEVTDANNDTASAALTIDVQDLPPPPAEVIIDNLDTQATHDASWTPSSGPNPYAGGSVYSVAGSASIFFRWTPDLNAGGTYRVSVWWTTYSNRATAARYEVNHANGAAEHFVDQRVNGGQWQELGIYNFAPGTAGYVELTGVATSGTLGADAVRFELVQDLPLGVDTTSLAGGTVQTAYAQTLTATGGQGPISWSISLGALPSGLTLDASTGDISGAPTVAGLSNFTVEVTDANNDTASAALSIDVQELPPPPAEVIIDNLDTQATFSGSWTLSGGPDPYAGGSVYSVAGSASIFFRWTPDLNAGGTYRVSVWWTTYSNRATAARYEVNHANGAAEHFVDQRVNGGQWQELGIYNFAPGTAGYVELTGVATSGTLGADAVRFELVQDLPLGVDTTSLAGGTVQTAYAQTLTATGGQDPMSWSISLGALPSGLTLDAGTGEISGTPTLAGLSNFTVEVTDANNNTASAPLSIDVLLPVSVDTASLTYGTVQTPYSQILTATGGQGPMSWDVSVGALPSGLTLDAGTGDISGTPTLAGLSNFTVEVTDANNNTASLTYGTVQTPYSQTLTATGGQGPMSWDVSVGTLPSGLTLDAGTGDISGTPTLAGLSNFTVEVTDANNDTASAALSIDVQELPPPPAEVIIDNLDTQATFSGSWTLSGGPDPYAGGSVYASAGNASVFFRWTPDLNAGGTYRVSVWWTTYSNRATAARYEVNHANGAAEHFVDQRVNGGQWQELGIYNFAPGTAGYVELTGVATSGTLGADAVRFELVQDLPLGVDTTSLAGGTVQTAYAQTLTATGGQGPISWSISLGALPERPDSGCQHGRYQRRSNGCGALELHGRSHRCQQRHRQRSAQN